MAALPVSDSPSLDDSPPIVICRWGVLREGAGLSPVCGSGIFGLAAGFSVASSAVLRQNHQPLDFFDIFSLTQASSVFLG
uniref:Uncharacterized protein n=1 Tax=Anguilla anguilla TaxID=7936 RepID=A0A0E9PPJ8_ANGAN